MNRVEVSPRLLQWARERGGLSMSTLERKFPKLEEWERGRSHPTLKQLESFARATHTPVGYLFLQEPPEEHVPIPDLRTVGNVHIGHPSPDLLEMIYVCQQRQEWYRDFARSTGQDSLSFVGSATVASDVIGTAASMRDRLGFDLEVRRRTPTWTDALRLFISDADALGILVMCSGVVLNNNRRRLNPDEFRGFAITDNLAPLVFINGADSKAAQMFTLAHEFAHIWLGQSAVSDSQAVQQPGQDIEGWCNRVAAELLVPLSALRDAYDGTRELNEETNRLARQFKVSTLVILRRIHDARGMTREQFWKAYEEEVARLGEVARTSGGNFYLTQGARVSKRFARAIVVSTLEGQTLYRDAFRMLGISKLQTFHELGRSLGVPV
jgi:Zn-dependent peptidase ImmA (M78 family)/transcriptional regulator with XRE-family HTH domain